MRKNILFFGSILIGLSFNAQVLFVSDNASVSNKAGLVYSGGTVQVDGEGRVLNQGDFKIDEGGLETTKNDGTNFLMDDKFLIIKDGDGAYVGYYNVNSKLYTREGKLWINTNSQSDIQGYIRKFGFGINKGVFKQLAIPFYNKTFKSLSDGNNMQIYLTNSKHGNTGFFVFNNDRVIAKHINNLNQTTNSTTAITGNHKASYYLLGAGIQSGSYYIQQRMTGQPFSSDDCTVSLSGAGSTVNFGPDGKNKNEDGAKYSSYVEDPFHTGIKWMGSFGKNYYQFGNPFLTNLDLTKIPSDLKNKIQGIRVHVSNPISYDVRYITFTSFGSAIPVGDVSLPIIRPMQVFSIKMKDGQTGNLDLAKLRTFRDFPDNTASGFYTGEYSAGEKGSRLSVRNLKYRTLSSNKETVKQLGVIALNKDGKELGRSYYVVYPQAHTGFTEAITTQVLSPKSSAIYTLEEHLNSTPESTNANKLYINEANEADYLGKPISLKINSDSIKSFKFELREDATLLDKGISKLSSNESFYFGVDGNYTSIAQGLTLPFSDGKLELFYGRPENSTLATKDLNKDNNSCYVVYDKSISSHKLIFNPDWNLADVKVFDISGKLILSEGNVNTKNDFIIRLPELNSVYIVTAISKNKNEKFSQKIIK